MAEEIMKPKKEKKLSTTEFVWQLAQPEAEKLGLEIWDVTYKKEGADWNLCIYIDKEDGINIDDCVNLTHAVNPLLDKEEPIKGAYNFEVSSPGLNRKLTRKEHFEKLMGAPLRVKLIRPMEDGVREIEGDLIGVADNGDFELKLNEETSITFTKKECSSVVLMDDDF
ncbi:MAG: ribosome maturation factor RimP [Clostridia bacterium]|nr:ribosome maturation factor RimP [Clostridia bacterium]